MSVQDCHELLKKYPDEVRDQLAVAVVPGVIFVTVSGCVGLIVRRGVDTVAIGILFGGIFVMLIAAGFALWVNQRNEKRRVEITELAGEISDSDWVGALTPGENWAKAQSILYRLTRAGRYDYGAALESSYQDPDDVEEMFLRLGGKRETIRRLTEIEVELEQVRRKSLWWVRWWFVVFTVSGGFVWGIYEHDFSTGIPIIFTWVLLVVLPPIGFLLKVIRKPVRQFDEEILNLLDGFDGWVLARWEFFGRIGVLARRAK